MLCPGREGRYWGAAPSGQLARARDEPRDPVIFPSLSNNPSSPKAWLVFQPGLHFLEMSGQVRAKLRPMIPEQLRERSDHYWEVVGGGACRHSSRDRHSSWPVPGPHLTRSIGGSICHRPRPPFPSPTASQREREGLVCEGHLAPTQPLCLDTLHHPPTPPPLSQPLRRASLNDSIFTSE